ncbi:hypothetical protein CCAND95_1760001 [Capnocytophaga canis]|uniref:Uncharacterized protein n=1 Tax=Capnocytophaga canis TaxID=1848903 RepID=A0A0B7HWA2_9FLAO|nr:hypothetical protein CCAND95_1760001 [Capnocytophaga canis]CEN44322.1 hypothetical protein CCAND38_1780002 [Capnocytophaga canis]
MLNANNNYTPLPQLSMHKDSQKWEQKEQKTTIFAKPVNANLLAIII